MKVSNEGQELIILLIIGFILYHTMVTEKTFTVGHEILQNMGVSQRIERFEERYFE